MSKLKTQNGITLIALVITIIVMLILVGVSVTVALNGGLFSTAQKATGDTKSERDNELALSDGKVTINGEEYNSIDEYVNGGSSNNLEEPTEPENPTGYTAYSIGQEVTVGGENFYVIADSDETNPNVTLLAKYNLNTEGTAQVNVTWSETACAFSSTNYWSSETEYPLDLNNYTIPEGETSVITTAKTYGEAKGGTGRLLKKEEVETLVTNYGGIISGTTIDATDGYLDYLLGSAFSSDEVLIMLGSAYEDGWFELFYHKFDDKGATGVRPVVEISKDKIS